MPNQWKRNPPCRAQQLLDEMFENKRIAPDVTALAAYYFHDEFQKFSKDVFRGAFNQTRQRHGVERNFRILK